MSRTDRMLAITALQPHPQFVLAEAHHSLEMDDEAALQDWLAVFKSRNQRTYRSYSSEAGKLQRFLQHLHREREGTPAWRYLLRDATENDLRLYQCALGFKTDPQIPPGLLTLVIGEGRGKKRPFTRALKQSSIDQALHIVHAMYENFRVANQRTKLPYVLSNPTARLIKVTSRARAQSERMVPQEAMQAMSETIRHRIDESLAGNDPVQLARAFRRRWIFILLFGLWARRAEICRLRMSDFRLDHDGWVVLVQRKGKSEPEQVAVSNWVMDGLKAYRATLGLPPTPSADDMRPVIAPLASKGARIPSQTLSPETIYQEVKAIAKDTAARARSGAALCDISPDRREFIIDKLDRFSPHWFRHTGASIAISKDLMSLTDASKLLGHSSPTMTSKMYYHPDRAAHRNGVDQLAGGL